MKCVYTFGTGRHKRQADITLLFQYMCHVVLILLYTIFSRKYHLKLKLIILIKSLYEPRHEISNNVVMFDQQRLRPACAYAQSDQSLCKSLKYTMIVKLLTEQHLEFLSLKGSCTGSSESTLVKIPHCWKSHALAHMWI